LLSSKEAIISQEEKTIKGLSRNEYYRQYRKEHPDAASSDFSRLRRWNKEHPEYARKKHLEYQRTNAERLNIHQRRRYRYKQIDGQRASGRILCYWCKGEVPKHRIKKCPKNNPPRFCSRGCFQQDLHEERLRTGYYAKFSELGNQAQDRIEQESGMRPGHAKRQINIKKASQARWKEDNKNVQE
jgi:hypothetical protein